MCVCVCVPRTCSRKIYKDRKLARILIVDFDVTLYLFKWYLNILGQLIGIYYVLYAKSILVDSLLYLLAKNENFLCIWPSAWNTMSPFSKRKQQKKKNGILSKNIRFDLVNSEPYCYVCCLVIPNTQIFPVHQQQRELQLFFYLLKIKCTEKTCL